MSSRQLDNVKLQIYCNAVKVGEDTKRAVLDASLSLINEQGLAGLSMREAARRAGVSHQAPYHYFSDREAILAALVVEGFQMLRAAMVASAENAPREQRLAAIGEAYVGFALAHRAHFLVMFRSDVVKAENHADAYNCAESALDVLVGVVSEVTEDEHGEADEALVLGAWSLAHGLATLLLEDKIEAACVGGVEVQTRVAAQVLARFAELIATRRARAP